MGELTQWIEGLDPYTFGLAETVETEGEPSYSTPIGKYFED